MTDATLRAVTRLEIDDDGRLVLPIPDKASYAGCMAEPDPMALFTDGRSLIVTPVNKVSIDD